MTTVNEQLVKHIDEAYAMEQNVLRMLDSELSGPQIAAQCVRVAHGDRTDELGIRGGRASGFGSRSWR